MSHGRPKNKVARCFSVTWVPKLLSPPVKLRFLAQKRPNLAQNILSWAHIGHTGSFGALSVGGCGARAVYRKTPIYFFIVKSRQKYDKSNHAIFVIFFVMFCRLAFGEKPLKR